MSDVAQSLSVLMRTLREGGLVEVFESMSGLLHLAKALRLKQAVNGVLVESGKWSGKRAGKTHRMHPLNTYA